VTVASTTRDPDAATSAFIDTTATAVASPRKRREPTNRTNLAGLSLHLWFNGGGEIGPHFVAFSQGFGHATASACPQLDVKAGRP
jgi:hypothetical protein